MAIIGEAKHFHTKWKFQLDIDGIGSAQFQNCSELKAELAKVEYYEGGVTYPYKEPGRGNVADITVERGVTYDQSFYDWLLDTSRAKDHWGLPSPEFKRGAFLTQFDRNNTVLRKWQLYGLWPLSVTVGSWDNNADELTMEQAVLVYDFFELHINNSYASPGSVFAGIRKAVGQIAR